jgi:predicted 3-demethylubiquinone-9 3-methyltransferase (glyoxalase superfamily)
MQKITPFLWFNDNAGEAIEFYTSVFKNSKVGRVVRYGDAGPGPKGTIMTGTIELEGQAFHLLNGGPVFNFTPAVSFFINCENQEEVDYFWEKLSEGGKKDRCGWLVDKFGLSWQVVPKQLSMLFDSEPAKAQRVMAAMMKMNKLIIKDLEEA